MKNYHTHTYRCRHAKGSDEDYVKEAIRQGYSTLGFSDHTCWRYKSAYQPYMRMMENQFDDYQNSILNLKEKYQNQIEIQCGLEAEYFPEYMEWLLDFSIDKNIEYLIFGNHFHLTDETGVYFGECSSEYIQPYIDTVKEGLKTGMYSCLAHPELIFINGIDWTPQLEEDYYEICKLAKKMDIPLEFNVYGFKKTRQFGFTTYPQPRFWEIASQLHNKAIIGMDAHSPKGLDKDLFNKAGDILSHYDVEIVDQLKRVNYKELKKNKMHG